MPYDNRQSISRSFFFLQTVALAVGLASIDKAFNAADQDLDQTENEAGKTVEQPDNAAREKFAASGRAVDNTALAARVNAALNAAPGLGSSTIDVGALDVHVETVKGAVRLSGRAVERLRQKPRSETPRRTARMVCEGRSLGRECTPRSEPVTSSLPGAQHNAARPAGAWMNGGQSDALSVQTEVV